MGQSCLTVIFLFQYCTLPAFLSPNVAKVLVENYGIAPISSVNEDMKLFLCKC